MYPTALGEAKTMSRHAWLTWIGLTAPAFHQQALHEGAQHCFLPQYSVLQGKFDWHTTGWSTPQLALAYPYGVLQPLPGIPGSAVVVPQTGNSPGHAIPPDVLAPNCCHTTVEAQGMLRVGLIYPEALMSSPCSMG